VEQAQILIEPVDFDAPSAQGVMSLAADELDRRYGPATDTHPFDAASFSPPRGTFLIARVDGHVAGGVGLRDVGDRHAEIKRLWVRPDLRRSGVGRALMDAAVEAGRELGVRTLILETGPLQPEAVALYRAHGWTEVEQLPVKVSDYPDAVRFVNELSLPQR
jgi:GNAT superfamily N-acetyltransferase